MDGLVKADPANLEHLFQGFVNPRSPGRLFLLRGSPIVLRLSSYIAGLATLRGFSILVVDAANAADPLIVARLAQRAGCHPHDLQERIFVTRCFTVYQLEAFLLQDLEITFEERHLAGCIVNGATSLFEDANVRLGEGYRMMREMTNHLRSLCRQGRHILVTAADPPSEARRKGLHTPWLQAAEQSLRIELVGSGLRCIQEKPSGNGPRDSQYVIPGEQILPLWR